MAKVKTTYFCQNCGAQSPKWIGKCNSCNEWNTFVEEIVENPNTTNGLEKLPKVSSNKPRHISEIATSRQYRIDTSNNEFNRLLGGGLVPGSITLLGGEPGIGKSTLMLQIALNIKGLKVLYVTGEESEEQLKLRAHRVSNETNDCYVLTETATQQIFQQIEKVSPGLLIIDSIQTLYTNRIESSAGSISQIRECAAELQRLAKVSNIPVILIGHITKEGMLAGPKLLEHMVDTVLQFEGNANHMYRILRATKNRFGSTSELGIYEMQSTGLIEVPNPSQIFMSQGKESLSGTAISATIEGAQPILIETQALVSTAVYGTPQRSATGFDTRRLNMLLAVLEKKCGFILGSKDVFLNLAGGLKIQDPAIDLGVICSILSSNEDTYIPSSTTFAGEISLTGEIRPVTRIEQRITEAEKLGFKKIVISSYSKLKNGKSRKIEVVKVGKVTDVFKLLF
jgi:DNA repair protein RadA/Sms